MNREERIAKLKEVINKASINAVGVPLIHGLDEEIATAIEGALKLDKRFADQGITTDIILIEERQSEGEHE